MTAGYCSGPPLADDAAQGWAVCPFVGKGSSISRAHCWRRGDAIDGTRSVRSQCGLRSVEATHVPLLEAGDYKPCWRCIESREAARRRR